MKNFTKTLVAATLALGAVSANASILTSTADMTGEAWLSVYDSTSAQTFTLDLGVAGVTAGSLYNQRATAGSLVNVDLTQFADWNAFLSTANLATTQYLVAANGVSDFTPKIMVTGSNAIKFDGVSFADMGALATKIGEHVLNVNADSAHSQDTSFNDTTLVVDGDGHVGQHNEGAGSNLLWGGAAYNANAGYGNAVDFQLATIDLATFSGVQSQFSGQWKLAGDSLTLGVSAVPVPAAVWMFGSALLGLAGVSRKRKTV